MQLNPEQTSAKTGPPIAESRPKMEFTGVWRYLSDVRISRAGSFARHAERIGVARISLSKHLGS
jgi:hypothetical protein